MLDGTDELFGVALGVLAESSLTSFSNAAILASNCANAASTNALTAGVISASISGGMVIRGDELDSAIHTLRPKSTIRVQIDFHFLNPARERLRA